MHMHWLTVAETLHCGSYYLPYSHAIEDRISGPTARGLLRLVKLRTFYPTHKYFHDLDAETFHVKAWYHTENVNSNLDAKFIK